MLSVVIPCFNEEAVIEMTHGRLVGVLRDLGMDFELVYVDDGSRDRTAEILRRLQQAEPCVRVVRLARNFGHQLAATAGLDAARGDAVVLIDADLQDPPEIIPRMVEKWREGFQVVYGQRSDRLGETRFKLWTAYLFYRMINRLSEVPIPADTGDFRLMDRAVVEALRSMPERHRLLRAMVSWVGFRQTPLPYQRQERAAGTTKYPLSKMLNLALDGIVSFSTAPLRMMFLLGTIMFGVSVIGIIYALALRLATSIWVEGWTLLFVAVLAIGGLQFICLGLMGEYIGRIYGEVKERPLYIVAERLGFTEGARAPAPAGQGRSGV